MPDPEILPEQAAGVAKVYATGRPDVPNQINSGIASPGIWRGALDCRATEINQAMTLAAATAIAADGGGGGRPLAGQRRPVDLQPQAWCRTSPPPSARPPRRPAWPGSPGSRRPPPPRSAGRGRPLVTRPRRVVRSGRRQNARRSEMLLARVTIGEFDQFWSTFTSAGAEHRRKYGSSGARVFRNLDQPGEMIVLFDWSKADYRRFMEDPADAGDHEGGGPRRAARDDRGGAGGRDGLVAARSLGGRDRPPRRPRRRRLRRRLRGARAREPRRGLRGRRHPRGGRARS